VPEITFDWRSAGANRRHFSRINEDRERVVFSSVKPWFGSPSFTLLTFFLVLVFLLGGGARGDILSLIVLRPSAVMLCFFAVWRLKWLHVQSNPFLFAMTVAIFALTMLHLVPLPSTLWAALPGRGIIAEIDKVAELDSVWRPISMIPTATLNAFFSLFVPLAVLLLAVQLNLEEQFKLLPVILGLGLLSGLWGILQIVGSPDGPLYLYDITNNGSAVGLFSNRNHQAMLLAALFPMLGVYASAPAKTEEQANVRLWLLIAAVIVLVPLLLITGSRIGLILGIIGLMSIALVYRKPTFATPKKRKTRTFDPRYPVAAFLVLCLGALTVVMSRAESFQRLFSSDQNDIGRFEMWAVTNELAWKYFPFGSGLGSFVEVYQIDEPYELLSPSYANHAHNDWLEIFMTAGLPGVVLLGVALFAFVKRGSTVLMTPLGGGRKAGFNRLGMIMITLLALGSISDYPLRTPSLSCVFVIAVIWFMSSDIAASKNTGSG
jgi:O-antigen ligase